MDILNLLEYILDACLDLVFVPRWVDGEGRLNCALSSRDAGGIKNEQSKHVCSNALRKMMLHLPWEACWLLLCISVPGIHTICIPLYRLLCSGCAGMPGHLVPGRPVLAGTFFLFWECTGVFIRLSRSAGYLPRRSIFSVCRHSLWEYMWLS